jgi:uncharacterized membrane protein YgcG
MNPIVGWGLAVIAVAAAWKAYGWQGVVMAASVIVFWLLIQFSRALRVMKNAAEAPVGHIGSTVMLNSKLSAGQTMMQVVTMTRSLGRRIDPDGDTWAWADDGGSEVTLEFKGGKLAKWTLVRPADTVEPPHP